MPSKTRCATAVSSRVHGYKILPPNKPKLYLYPSVREITAFICCLRGIPKDSYIHVHNKKQHGHCRRKGNQLIRKQATVCAAL